MTIKESIGWFKKTFDAKLKSAIANTPYSTDLLCAMAYQETGYIWSTLAGKNLSLAEITMLSVGDTIDTPKRSAFPKNKAELLAAPNGLAMFNIARECLLQMAKHIPGYNSAVINPNKFCHGYGIFQYDLQFYKTNPDYFLKKKWADVDHTFDRCINELNEAKKRQGWQAKNTLTDDEKVYVAIAYNQGKANLSKGFRQGHFDGKKYYGENVFEYMRLSQTIAPGTMPAAAPVVVPTTTVAPAQVSPAPIPPPTPVLSNKKIYKVKDTSSGLNLRSEAVVTKPTQRTNVLTTLPGGHSLSWLSGKITDEWLEVETSIRGAYFKGFVSTKYIELVKDNSASIPIIQPATAVPVSGIIAVSMPRRQAVITKRTEAANALSLNEPGQPSRSGSPEADVLKKELIAIADWLNVEKVAHKRYQPGNGATFCNIYAHDFCHLAGVYLPRVWWTQPAIAKLAAGQTVDPLYGNTIEEIRANNLLRWLKDFGGNFGWRQTGDLTKLQHAANLGALGLIIARRKEEGKSGHVTMVLPENNLVNAKRDTLGNVSSTVQSQAGRINFKMRNDKAGWWLGNEFAEYSYWIHA